MGLMTPQFPGQFLQFLEVVARGDFCDFLLQLFCVQLKHRRRLKIQFQSGHGRLLFFHAFKPNRATAGTQLEFDAMMQFQDVVGMPPAIQFLIAKGANQPLSFDEFNACVISRDVRIRQHNVITVLAPDGDLIRVLECPGVQWTVVRRIEQLNCDILRHERVLLGSFI